MNSRWAGQSLLDQPSDVASKSGLTLLLAVCLEAPGLRVQGLQAAIRERAGILTQTIAADHGCAKTQKQLNSTNLEQSGHEQSLGCWRGRKVQGCTRVLHPVWASELVHVKYDLQIMHGWSLGQAAGPFTAHVGSLQLWPLPVRGACCQAGGVAVCLIRIHHQLLHPGKACTGGAHMIALQNGAPTCQRLCRTTSGCTAQADPRSAGAGLCRRQHLRSDAEQQRRA